MRRLYSNPFMIRVCTNFFKSTCLSPWRHTKFHLNRSPISFITISKILLLNYCTLKFTIHILTFVKNVSVTYMRPMSTNEPVKDKMIPNTETSVIAAIGPLNLRGEANAHQSFDKTTEDIRIDFTSRNVHECTNSLYNLPDMSDIKPWPVAVITNETMFSARIGPAGGKRGYTRITGNLS